MIRLLVTFIALIGILFPYDLSCKIITQKQAQSIADNFFRSSANTRSTPKVMQLAWTSEDIIHKTKGNEENPTFYVFAGNGSKGFVIVAGDDVIDPVLGYSVSEPAPLKNDVPPALKMWLKDIDNHIISCRGADYKDSPVTKAENITSKAGVEMIYLQTAKWNQNTPFNNECPMDGDKRSLTGCVATAAGIIMRYHKWPDAGVGSTTAYIGSSKGISVPARNFAHLYDWDNMPHELVEGSYTMQQANEIAVLLADLGAAYTLDYTSNETSGLSGYKPLFKYFKYSSGMSTIARVEFLKEKFDQILKRELHSMRPILYSGRNINDSGHSFVIDGYDSNDFFHINWGWGGKSDGYYAITEHSYSLLQQAHINIIPEMGNNENPEYWVTFAHDGLKSTVNEYSTGSTFSITANPSNHTVVSFNGYVRLGITDRNGTIKEWISGENHISLNGNKDYNSLYYYTYTTFSCKISCELEVGDRIRMFYRQKGSSKWNLSIADPKLGNGIRWEIPVGDLFTIRESTSVRFDRENKIITFSLKDGVSATVLHNGSAVVSGITKLGNSIAIDMTKLSGEKYVLKLEKGKEREELEFSVKPTKDL